MKRAQKQNQWVWVIVENSGGKEHFLGQHDQQENIAFIPVFHTKADAQQCFGKLTLRPGYEYEVQAILYDELKKDAAANGFVIFLLNENGEVLEKIAP